MPRRYPPKTAPPFVNGLLVAAMVLCGAAGCAKKSSPPKSMKPGTVTVLSRGSTPRHRLRYRFNKGETLRYRLTSSRRITGMPPGAAVVADLSVHTARVDGRRARLRWQVDKVQGKAHGQLPLWVETSDRGEITNVSQSRRPRAPRAASTADGKPLGQSVRQLYLAWPEPAVGPGARWEQRRDLILAASARGGIRARVSARYTFDSVAPCGQSRCAHLSVRTRIEVSHRAGRVRVKGTGDGTGSVVFDLGSGRLVESRTRGDVGLSTSLRPDQVVQRLRLRQSLVLTR